MPHPFIIKNQMEKGLLLTTEAIEKGFTELADYFQYLLHETYEYDNKIYSVNSDFITHITGIPPEYPLAITCCDNLDLSSSRIVINDTLDGYRTTRPQLFNFLLTLQDTIIDVMSNPAEMQSHPLDIDIRIDAIVMEKLGWDAKDTFDILTDLYIIFEPIFEYLPHLKEHYNNRIHALTERWLPI